MPPLRPLPKWLVATVLTLSFIGFADASYLTTKHYLGGTVPCSILNGCETVLNSSYATLGPVPVALLGSLFYLAIFILAFAYVDTKRVALARGLAWLSILGLLASVRFVYLQVVVIKALCLYCLVSATTSLLLSIGGVIILTITRRATPNAPGA